MEPKNKYTRMRSASCLLPDPGGEVVRELLDDVERITKQRDELLAALCWYGDEAKAIAANMLAKKDSAVLASVHVLALDAGKRASTAIDAAIASVKEKP